MDKPEEETRIPREIFQWISQRKNPTATVRWTKIAAIWSVPNFKCTLLIEVQVTIPISDLMHAKISKRHELNKWLMGTELPKNPSTSIASHAIPVGKKIEKCGKTQKYPSERPNESAPVSSHHKCIRISLAQKPHTSNQHQRI
jgi:hypothetical protein